MSASSSLYETFAKTLAYIDDQPNFQSQIQALLNRAGYKVDKTFDDPTTSFHALGLVSTTPDKAPVLIFRGTYDAGDDAALSDSRGIGTNQFEANQTALQTWIDQVSQDKTKNPNQLLPDLVGHSLGGALAQLTAVKFAAIVGNVLTFNSPGIESVSTAQFEQSRPKGATVTHYITSGDFVSLAGNTFIPGKVFLQLWTDPNINPLTVREKHRVEGLLSTPPAGFIQREISVAELSNPAFTFNNDSDFNEFTTAISGIFPQYANALKSRQGAETLRTTPGTSFLTLLAQVDAVLDPVQNNFLVGDNLANTGFGFQGSDVILGNGGNDSLYGNQNDDILIGGSGNNILYGGQNNDLIYGNQGTDFIAGDQGNDTLFGGQGNDTIIGGNGDDILRGDLGNDLLAGGNGKDLFVLLPNYGTDTITDFQDGQDILGLGGDLFGQIEVSQGSNGTVISVAGTGEVLAILTGIQASTITDSDFVEL
jgi:serralysin